MHRAGAAGLLSSPLLPLGSRILSLEVPKSIIDYLSPPESSLVFSMPFYWAYFHDFQCRIISIIQPVGKSLKEESHSTIIVLLEYYMCTWKPLSFSTSRDFIGHPWLIMYHLYCICNK